MNSPRAAFDIEKLRGLMGPGGMGADLRYLPVVGSTNRYFRDSRTDTWAHGTLVITDFQTTGRGRRGRAWSAPPGSSLLFSIALQWPDAVPLSWGVMLATLAIVDSIKALTGRVPDIKWPNDVLFRGRKVCGILAESLCPGTEQFLIVGCGVNVNFDPAAEVNIPDTATSLLVECGHQIDREALAAAVMVAFDHWHCRLYSDPRAIFTAWESKLAVAGLPLTITDGRGTWAATAAGVREDGGLHVVKEDGGQEVVYAADVSVRPREHFTTR